MKTVTNIGRGIVVVVVTIAAFLGENSAKGHVVPRQMETMGRPSAAVGQLNRRGRQPMEGWMGPTRQTTVWR